MLALVYKESASTVQVFGAIDRTMTVVKLELCSGICLFSAGGNRADTCKRRGSNHHRCCSSLPAKHAYSLRSALKMQ